MIKDANLIFPYSAGRPGLLGPTRRPIAVVSFWSKLFKGWKKTTVVVDTGADYTVLPRSMAEQLGISLEKECKIASTSGIGGEENVYLLPEIKIRIGEWERKIPALLGRFASLDTFSVTFAKFKTSFALDR